MTAFVALLRAVNVGGAGRLPMGDLRRLCEAAGLERVQTYIASHVAILLDGPPPADALNGVVGRNGEDTHLGLREIYVRYGDGMAASKLKILARL